MRRPERLALAQLVDALEEELDGPGWMRPLHDIAVDVEAARDAADAARAAARLVQQCHPVATIDEAGRGRAAATDALAVLQAAFRLTYRWQLARSSEHVVFGPRFAQYPAIVAVDGGVPALDTAAAIIERSEERRVGEEV